MTEFTVYDAHSTMALRAGKPLDVDRSLAAGYTRRHASATPTP
jgi:hypothetical protein